MKPKEALRQVISNSGKSGIAISHDIGRADNYVYSLMNKKTEPSISTLTSIADACDYDVTLLKRDGTDKIVIDPPEK